MGKWVDRHLNPRVDAQNSQIQITRSLTGIELSPAQIVGGSVGALATLGLCRLRQRSSHTYALQLAWPTSGSAALRA
jgi:hypothetical protein